MSTKTVVIKFSTSLRIVLVKLALSFPKTHSQFLFSFNCHCSCVVKLLFTSGHHKALLNFPMPRKLRAERAPRKTCIFLTRSFHLTSLLYLSPNAEQRLGFALLLALSFLFCFLLWPSRRENPVLFARETAHRAAIYWSEGACQQRGKMHPTG